MNKLKTTSRILLIVCSVALVAVNFLPMWRIDLEAPQYPEGLSLSIHPDGLGGSVDIINGLNHYIGMKTLHSEDFPEFVILPWIIYLMSFLFALVVFLNRLKWLKYLFGFFVVFSLVSMADFWRWEYNYGHNLDPNAAIRVPGMAYQPPLIGYKQLLNFSAYSVPDVGGWIFIAVGLTLAIVLLREWKWNKQPLKVGHPTVLAIALMLMLPSCSPHPEPIILGKDECAFCRMKVSDPRFAAEVVSTKGKVFKFDDISCAAQFIQKENLLAPEIFGVYFSDYTNPQSLLNADSCILFQCDELRSPMNGNVAALSSKEEVKQLPFAASGKITRWQEYLTGFAR
ncbi:MAG: nitrous oxide reductase accessory protein NosL [Flavobacteriales bacterium]|nr:nitrous oxide reductase accessory protein NosL [Flavobacteriales bacterium]